MIIPELLACPTCASNFKDGGANAAGNAILFMLVLIVPMLCMVGVFMVRIIRRERASLDPSLSDDFDPASFQQSRS